MNRTILTSVALSAVLGLCQAASAVEPSSTNSPVLLAAANQPSGLANVAMAAGTHASLIALNTKLTGHGGTVEYAFKGDAPLDTSVPHVTKTVEVNLSGKELEEAPAVTTVTLRALVDPAGVPYDVSVTKSAGAAVDQKAIAAVKEYRFTPAKIDYVPTWSSVIVKIKIEK